MLPQIQVPDIASNIARVEQIQGSRLQQLAAMRGMEDAQRLQGVLGEVGPALFGTDPEAQRLSLQRLLAEGGPGAFPIALNIQGQIAQQADRTAQRDFQQRQLDAMERYRQASLAARTAGAPAPAGPQVPTLGNSERGNAANILTTIAPKVLAGTATPDEIEVFAAAGEVWQRPQFDPSTGQFLPAMAMPPRAAQAFALLRGNAGATPAAAPGQPGSAPPPVPGEPTNTGSIRLPGSGTRQLTAAELTLREETENTLSAARSAMSTLERALALSPQAYAGPLANMRGSVAGFTSFDTPTAVATRELDTLMGQQALQQLRAIFGGNPTEGERNLLLQLEANSGMSKAEREALIRNAIEAVKQRETAAARRLGQVVRGEFGRTDPGFAAPPASIPGPGGVGTAEPPPRAADARRDPLGLFR